MKKLILVFVLCALLAAPAMAVTTIAFGEGAGGSWSYTTGSKIFDFNPSGSLATKIFIGSGLGLTTDTLVTTPTWIEIPSLLYDGVSTVTTTGGSTIKITDGGTDYFTGALGSGTLVDGGSLVGLYGFSISEITIGSIDNSIGSNALTAIQIYVANGGTKMDIAFSMVDSTNIILTAGSSGSGVISGTIDFPPYIPAPGAILLGSIGVCLVGWLRRRRTL